MEKACFAAGCFWCVEAVFQRVSGVYNIQSGYIGGKIKNPTYREVCSGLTGHAEAILFDFDPKIISFEQLLYIFFLTHDPTTLNRQGADIGTQYRSAVFFMNEEQKLMTEKVIAAVEHENIFDSKIVTTLEPFDQFYKAEDYHQNYYNQNPDQGYCSFVIKPKVNKLRNSFSKFLNPEII